MLALVIVASGTLVVTVSRTGAVAGKNGTYKLSSTLSTKREVPAPAGTAAGEGGAFTGTLKGKTVKFRLTFHNLTGPATAAHIHLGKPGKAGAVIVPLCGPCKSPVTRTMAGISSKARDAIERGNAYVNVHTAKNPGGEIRGQVKAKES
jgi:hypothetical protein